MKLNRDIQYIYTIDVAYSISCRKSTVTRKSVILSQNCASDRIDCAALRGRFDDNISVKEDILLQIRNGFIGFSILKLG